MKYPFMQVDVFSTQSCLGNPVAVFLESDGLSTDDMQRIARWTNLSETTFVSTAPNADYHVRIFTPSSELPFAGHPTIGTAFALRQAGKIRTDHFVQSCAFGLVQLHAKSDRISFELPSFDVETLNQIALTPGVFGVPLLDPMLITTGPRWIIARLDDSADILKLKVDLDCLLKLFAANTSTGITVYQFKAGSFQVRTFFEVDGTVVEDPVCGSGNAAVAVHVMQTGLSQLTGDAYVAHQGQAIGRDGQIFVELGTPIRIGGHCNLVFDGTAHFGA